MSIQEEFGSLVFNTKTMSKYLSHKTYESLLATMENGTALDATIADEVASGMKTWAMEHGATHFTHWFQPLNGTTAEKHDAFYNPDFKGGIVASFSGKELIQGEPDASSFPSGGLRATFEARGYTAWDPTSPAFIKVNNDGVAVLCIPTMFYGYHGEALDKKIPLLRAQVALAKQINRVAKLFGVPGDKRPFATLGPEQEYFLVDAEVYRQRPDLVQTGRTLFGVRPARHQQLEDHYFGKIKNRVLSFMAEVDKELWKLGVPAKTRHNEVSPAQFELAPVFEEQNLSSDHNMLTMEVLQTVAERYGLVCLLHEKPFDGVNGSGKHNNWSITGPDGKNWLSPGKTPHENAQFLTVLVSIIKGVDTYAPLLRATVASAGNDHRLGANEAPPAIISIFLGEQLTDIINQLEKGKPTSTKSGSTMEIGVSMLPPLPKDATDRNRTSPFAFTGNKFEFRAVGSEQNCATTNTALNTIVAWALDDVLNQIEALTSKGSDFNSAVQSVLQKEIKDHKRVLFDGNGYSGDWEAEAAKRGLPNLKTTPEAIEAYRDPKVIELYKKYSVLSEVELESRYVIEKEKYETMIALEANCALMMAKTMYLPECISYAAELADSCASLTDYVHTGVSALAKSAAENVEKLTQEIDKLEKAIDSGDSAAELAGMKDVRSVVDALERIVPDSQWPVPGYGEMFFVG
ncbi:MAG: glutamine synthetase III [Hallerella succinigenes]|uniref:glutamine synthetase III family protein n=1 Tax=Hallerella succinigenes TaxID=1896222 RepID=UPI0023EFA7E9|nr:glutamine synthetase III [Hallerella succinigenes]MDD6091748.1 glutamine synthetase III [Hallerella succinigenes]